MQSVAVNRYALALFHAAKRENALEAVAKDLKELESLYVDTGLKSFFANPQIRRERKEFVIRELGKKLSSVLTQGFLLLLLKKSRMEDFIELVEAYERLVEDSKGILPCQVILPYEPNQALKDRIHEHLTRITHSNVELDIKVNSKMLGGIAIRIKNYKLDASIRSQIDKLKQQMLEIRLN